MRFDDVVHRGMQRGDESGTVTSFSLGSLAGSDTGPRGHGATTTAATSQAPGPCHVRPG